MNEYPVGDHCCSEGEVMICFLQLVVPVNASFIFVACRLKEQQSRGMEAVL